MLHRPLLGSLHPSPVQGLVDQVAFTMFILYSKYIGSDLDQETEELTPVPLVENLLQLIVCELTNRLENIICLSDQLYVTQIPL